MRRCTCATSERTCASNAALASEAQRKDSTELSLPPQHAFELNDQRNDAHDVKCSRTCRGVLSRWRRRAQPPCRVKAADARPLAGPQRLWVC